MNFLTCPKCNMNFLPHEIHYCPHYFLPSGRSTTNSNASFSTREQNNTQTTPYLSDEVYHQSAIYNSCFGNISSNLDRVTSESQEKQEINRDFANRKVGSNGGLPPFRSTFFSSENGKCNYEMPNANQRLTIVSKSASVTDVPNEACTGIQQMSNFWWNHIYSYNMLNARCMISNKEQTTANFASVRQSPIGSKASENSGFSASREEHDRHASDSDSKKKHFVCQVCHKEFTSSSNLKTHSVVHSADRPFICDVCGKSFRLKHHLKNHKILLSHNPSSDASSSRENSCSFCGKVLPSKSHLESHAKMHTAERPFVCDICKKAFKRKWDLKAHSVLHSEPKLYECNICKKAFSHMSSLKSHYLVHTEKNGFNAMCARKCTQRNSIYKGIGLIIKDKMNYNMMCVEKPTVVKIN